MKISLIITDLDNTLWPWFEIWYARFSAFLNELHALSGIPVGTLTSEIKQIHEKHGTTEYPFLLQELPSLDLLHESTKNLTEIYASAILASQNARKMATKTYPGVIDTLKELQKLKIKVVGYTESQSFYTEQRLRTLAMDGLLDRVFTPATSKGQSYGVVQKELKHSPNYYKLEKTLITELQNPKAKPNPELLDEIITAIGGDHERCCYVGDSLTKDVAMANELGITSVFAAYGVVNNDPRYELLRKVTHWTPDEVQAERETTELDTSPSITISSFPELLTTLNFESIEASE